MNIENFKELLQIGLKPIPIIRDESAEKEVIHLVNHSSVTEAEIPIDQWLDKIEKANGIALKLFSPFGTIDFDIKNTHRKDIYSKWLNIIESTNPEVLRKVCIETTRNGGYHCYIKYPKLQHKITVAASEQGAEVIAVYTGGLLSYCHPTPGYQLIHNSFEDIEELTDDEYDLLVSTSALFNEYVELPQQEYEPISYPQHYEEACLLFDRNITDDAFEQMLNEMTLYPVKDFRYNRRQKFTAYKRTGSTANYSAKVYFSSRKVLLFTTSLQPYPSWADKKNAEDRGWILTPTRIIYYKNGKDWVATMQEIQTIADSIGIDIVQHPVAQMQEQFDRMKFPYDIYPEVMQEYIKSHRIQHEYIAAFMLAAVTTAIGNTCYVEPLQGYKLRPSLYLAVVAFPGGGKSPAMKVAFDYLQRYDNDGFMEHKARLAAYNEELNIYEKNRKGTSKPSRPILSQTLINDATMETVINVLQFNQKGCCLVADELAGFMKRMSQYKDGDDSQKWLEMWDSSPVMQQRITTDERKIYDYTMSIAGGIQPGVINALAKGDNAVNGFYHRFLFAYPEPEAKLPFEAIEQPTHLKAQIDAIFDRLMIYRSNELKDRYTLSESAAALYKQWHDYKNLYYNRTHDENAKGIIAKYQAYCLRFALVLQCLDDLDNRTMVITQSAMDRAIRLTEYFLGNMLKSLKLLAPETPIDGLKAPYDKFYNELPAAFSTKTALEIGAKYKLKAEAVRLFLSRKKELFEKEGRGNYCKII